MNAPQTWTDALTDELRTLVGNGCSGGQAARMLGLTRNQVISKASRMGLRFGSSIKAVAKPAQHEDVVAQVSPVVPRVAVKKARATISTSASNNAPRPAPPEVAAQRADDYLTSTARRRAFDPAFAPAGAKLVPLVELERGMCKWPLFESGPAIFCGCAVNALDAAGQPDRYCDHHAQMSRGTS